MSCRLMEFSAAGIAGLSPVSWIFSSESPRKAARAGLSRWRVSGKKTLAAKEPMPSIRGRLLNFGTKAPALESCISFRCLTGVPDRESGTRARRSSPSHLVSGEQITTVQPKEPAMVSCRTNEIADQSNQYP